MMDLLDAILVIHREAYEEVLCYQTQQKSREAASFFTIPVLHLLSTTFF